MGRTVRFYEWHTGTKKKRIRVSKRISVGTKRARNWTAKERGLMHLEQREDGWWIVEVPGADEDCGPYKRKADAVSDRRGMVQFFKHCDEGNFFNGEEKIRHAN